MKKRTRLLGITLLGLAASTHAQVSYHVKEGYFGRITIKASGSCGFEPFRLENVWFGVVHDESDTPLGWGLLTASGQLLFWEEDYAKISLKENTDIGTGKDTSYSNLVGQELFDLVTARSGCNIEVLEPDTGSRTVMKWDAMRGRDTVELKALFGGFDASVCQPLTNGQRCSAGAFRGMVQFRGDWSTSD